MLSGKTGSMTTLHTASAFDADMKNLHARIMAMGGLVEAAIDAAVKALDTRDDELASLVVRDDRKIDALEDEVNAAVVRMLDKIGSETCSGCGGCVSLARLLRSV